MGDRAVLVSEFNEVLQDIARETLYTENNVNFDINNLSKIHDCEKLSFTDLLKILNFKGTTVQLSSNLGNGTILQEFGVPIRGGISLSAKVNLGSASITKVVFYKDNIQVSSIINDLNRTTYTYAYGLDINNSTTFKVTVFLSDNTSVSSEVKIKFCNPFYFGVTSKEITDLTPTDITSGTKKVAEKGNYSHPYSTTNQRCFVAYDKNYGVLKSILDPSSFENLASFVRTEMTIGSTVYYVYTLKNKVYCNNFAYTFKF